MNISQELITLASYLVGEFENRQQAMASPVWYVSLRLWHRPVPVALFSEPGLVLFAEQANTLQIDRPYRQRIMQIRHSVENPNAIEIQYYMPKDRETVLGAGRDPQILKQLKAAQLELLPGCTLKVTLEELELKTYKFKAKMPSDSPCCFTYKGQNYQVELGFEATREQFLSYDKGIDFNTGKATWGALLGPYHFVKLKDFASELVLPS
jgi:hypothetical protein